MRTIGLAVLGLIASSAFAQDSTKSSPIFVANVRVVVRPGEVIEKTNLLLENGIIAAIGTNLTPPTGANTIDATGLTAYAGFIHPMLRTPLDGTPSRGSEGTGGEAGAPGGGRGPRPQQSTAEANAAQAKRDADPFGLETNVMARIATDKLTQKAVPTFADWAKNGFTLANLSASGGLVGPSSAVTNLGSPELSSASFLAKPGDLPMNFASRGFGSYPGSTMGCIAVIRQALFDGQRHARLKIQGRQPTEDVALAALARITQKSAWAVFDGLNEVSFLQAKKIADEFGLRALYGLRSDAGMVADLLQQEGAGVMLKGFIPPKPSLGTNFESASLNAVRAYFREVQAGSELERLGIRFAYAPESALAPLDGLRTYVRAGLSREAALASLTTRPAELLGLSETVGTIEKRKRADIVLVQGDLFNSSSQIIAVFAAGQPVKFDRPALKNADSLKADPPIKTVKPNYEYFPAPAETFAAFRLYKNATLWTQGPRGVIQGGDILIRGGKIVAVGKNLKAPAGCEVIDAAGKHISPGIWDCHSHTGISGGVNEGSNMVTIECRISDVINHRAPSIYQQLSGGTVGAQQLHGSANAIGGQSSPVKWRWGARSSDLPISGAPLGVKFALGQNPIREDTGGFGGQQQPVGKTLLTWRPRTRMGVEESIRRALQLGKEYNQLWADFRAGKTQVEPRRNLQLEGLGELVSGKRLIHSHGYRADELLMLIRVASEYGCKIATLQHVLEGYKIADEMAQAGIGGSTFSDWWGYKLEAYDAIPYNAALMAERGVSVSINSDSDNHARRLNIEAAKTIRNGGTAPEVALSFVTIEPARQMGIADKTGSLEAGKDADIAIWSADPTSIFAICLETYVDGIKRFDRANDARQQKDRLAELAVAAQILAEKPNDTGNPLDTGNGGPAAKNAPTTSSGKTTAAFGIGPISSQPGSMRYSRKPVLLSGGTVHPMIGDPFVGDILIGSDGKIAKVGKGISGAGAIRIACKGKHVYPGLIDPSTTIGLNEIGQVPASDDSSERGDFHPDYRVERTINPEWETMAVARQQGVLTVLVRPAGTGFAGQSALIHTEGFTWEDYTIAGGVAMMVASGGAGAFGFEGASHRHDDGEEEFNLEDCCNTSGIQRGTSGASVSAAIATLDTRIAEARDYEKRRAAANAEKPEPLDQRYEAVLQVANGKLPVMINAGSATDIKAAVEWAEKSKVRLVLYGCSGAGEIAEWLAQKDVPIILSALFTLPGGEQPVDSFYSLPSKLAKAGVRFCLTTDNDKDVRQIRDQAGWATAYGLNREEAARTITLRAAEVLGISDRLGAIKEGMDGTVIVTDGDIVEIKTHVLHAFIQGREVSLENRQTKLYDKYRARPKPIQNDR